MEQKAKSNVPLIILMIVLGITVVIFIIVLAFSLGRKIGIRSAQTGNTFIDETLTDEPDKTLVTEDSDSTSVVNLFYLHDILDSASDLIISKYYFTNIGTYNDHNSLGGFKVPLTTTSSVFTYNGVISLGFNVKDIVCKIDDNVITIIIPDIQILSTVIDYDTFKVYDQKTSLFNPMELEDATALLSQLEKESNERVMNNEPLLEQTRINAQTVIKQLLGANPLFDSYTIIVK